MILSRLTRAVREQNWFAVLLEFTIVAAGVMFAFLITDAAQERRDRADAAIILERLTEDHRALAGRVDHAIRQWEAVFQAHSRVIEAVESGAPPADPDALRADAYLMVQGELPPRGSLAVAELGATGRMNLVRDVELRRALIALDDGVELMQRQFEIAGENTQDAYDGFVLALTFEGEIVPNGFPRQGVREIDLDYLRSDPTMIARLSHRRVYVGFILGWLRLLRAQVGDTLERLEEASP